MISGGVLGLRNLQVLLLQLQYFLSEPPKFWLSMGLRLFERNMAKQNSTERSNGGSYRDRIWGY